MKKSLIAGAGVAAFAMAAFPFAGVIATDANQQATDTIQVTVSPSCTFTAGSGTATYSATGTNGQDVNPSVTVEQTTSNQHSFTVFCNNNTGYKVSATAGALNRSTPTTDKFVYVGGDAPTLSGVNGQWHAQIAKTTASLTVTQLASPTTGESTTADIITLGEASVTGGETFTATYTAHIGSETPAGLYSGEISYTLAAN